MEQRPINSGPVRGGIVQPGARGPEPQAMPAGLYHTQLGQEEIIPDAKPKREPTLLPMEAQILEAAQRGRKLVPVEEKVEGSPIPIFTLKDVTDEFPPVTDEDLGEDVVPPTIPEVAATSVDTVDTVMGPLINAAGLDQPVQAPVLDDSKPEEDEAIPAAFAPAVIPPCPRCGHEASDTLFEPPTDDDKLAFVEAVLGGIPFERNVTMLGSRFEVSVVMPTPLESDAVQKLVAWKGKKRGYDSMDEMVEEAIRYLSAVSVRHCRFGAHRHSYDPIRMPDDIYDDVQLESFHKRVHERLKEFGVRLSVFRRAYLQVEEIYKVLMVRSSDINFW